MNCSLVTAQAQTVVDFAVSLLAQADISSFLEARTWLISDITSADPNSTAREAAWRTLLPQPGEDVQYRSTALTLLQLLAEQQPEQLGQVLADRPDVFVDFFSGATVPMQHAAVCRVTNIIKHLEGI